MKTENQLIETKFMYLYNDQWFFYNHKWYQKKGPTWAYHKDGTRITMSPHDPVQFDKPKTNEVRKHMFRFRFKTQKP